MDAGLVVTIALAAAFAVTNGLHDAANAIAALVATRGATPKQAIVLASVFNLLGPLLLGAAVGTRSVESSTVDASVANRVIADGARLGGDLERRRVGTRAAFELGQALVGGLVGAALAEGGTQAVDWGGFNGGRPSGVVGSIVALAISPPLGAFAALVLIRLLRRAGRRMTRRWRGGAGRPVGDGGGSRLRSRRQRRAEVGRRRRRGAARRRQDQQPRRADLGRRHVLTALTLGTALGGWKIIRTVGRRIYRIGPLEGLASTSASAVVIFGASLLERRPPPPRSSPRR